MSNRLVVLSLTAALAVTLAGCSERPPSVPKEGGVSPGDGGADGGGVDISFCVPRCEGKPCGGDNGCGGSCTVGFCALGQRCDNGVCRCDVSSCPEGCCRDDACFSGQADSHCGTSGSACIDCLALNQSCGADQACFACQPQCAGKACGAPNGCDGICSTGSCPSGQTCVGGQCLCNSVSCGTGCCRDNLCYPGTEDSHCGTGGGLCADCQPASQHCDVDRVCRTCQPQCAGKTCGAPDGCGGTCQTGSCASGQTCVNGQCVCNGTSCPNGCCEGTSCRSGDADTLCGTGGAACANCTLGGDSCVNKACLDCGRWRAGPFGANMRDAAVDTDGRIYAVGATATQSLLARIDSCGAVQQQSSWGLSATVTRRVPAAVQLVGNDLWIAGTAVMTTDPANGFYARFTKSDLAVQADKGLFGTAGADEVWSLVWTGSAFFMNGTADYEVSPQVWALKGDTTPTACGFTVFPSGAGNGRRARLDPNGSFVYMTGGQSGAAFVARYPTSACAVSNCGSCTAPWSMTFQVDGLATEGRDVIVVGSSVYVAGFYRVDATNIQGFVAKIDPAAQAVSQIYRWTPGAKNDALLALAYDGTLIYVGGGKNLEADLSGGNAVILALSPALVRQWERTPGEPRAYWDVELHGTDGLILTGGSETQGYVRRCLRSGACP